MVTGLFFKSLSDPFHNDYVLVFVLAISVLVNWFLTIGHEISWLSLGRSIHIIDFTFTCCSMVLWFMLPFLCSTFNGWVTTGVCLTFNCKSSTTYREQYHMLNLMVFLFDRASCIKILLLNRLLVTGRHNITTSISLPLNCTTGNAVSLFHGSIDCSMSDRWT